MNYIFVYQRFPAERIVEYTVFIDLSVLEIQTVSFI